MHWRSWTGWRATTRSVLDLRVGELIYSARTAAGLTQKQLADRMGTGQSAVARLEDADYQGHSLNMLKRVARALGYRVHLEFEKLPERKAETRQVRAQPAGGRSGSGSTRVKHGRLRAKGA